MSINRPQTLYICTALMNMYFTFSVTLSLFYYLIRFFSSLTQLQLQLQALRQNKQSILNYRLFVFIPTSIRCKYIRTSISGNEIILLILKQCYQYKWDVDVLSFLLSLWLSKSMLSVYSFLIHNLMCGAVCAGGWLFFMCQNVYLL